MPMKLLNTELFLNSPLSGPSQTREIKTAKTFTRNSANELVPNSGSFYDASIFGFSSREIFDQFAYIKLEEPVLHPFIFKNLGKLGGLFSKCISKSISCIIVNGMIEEVNSEKSNVKGSNGVSFIINNFNRINFDKYKNDRNEDFIKLLQGERRLIIINKIPVIPIGYRNYSNKHGMIEEDEITDIYKKIININESKDWIKDLDDLEKTEFENVIQSIYKDTSKKEYVQRYLQTLYDYFLGKLEKKDGLFNASLFAKRIDNVARYVINAQPDIPSDCAAFPWQGLLIMFDVFIISYLHKEEEIAKKLGLYDKLIEDIGKKLEYIYKNTEEYLTNYPEHETIWIQMLTDIFNNNPEVRVITKRDPGWTPLSWWTFKPLILTGIQYQMIVPSIIYAPIGGDSFSTNYIIKDELINKKQTDIVFEDTENNTTIRTKNTPVQKIYNIYNLMDELGHCSLNEISPNITSVNIDEDDTESFEALMKASGITKIKD